jgi:hypothetical protein
MTGGRRKEEGGSFLLTSEAKSVILLLTTEAKSVLQR